MSQCEEKKKSTYWIFIFNSTSNNDDDSFQIHWFLLPYQLRIVLFLNQLNI